jgi:hypothetical protein
MSGEDRLKTLIQVRFEPAMCSICEKPIDSVDLVTEKRPTGDSFQDETWFYCQPCWNHLNELRNRDLADLFL